MVGKGDACHWYGFHHSDLTRFPTGPSREGNPPEGALQKNTCNGVGVMGAICRLEGGVLPNPWSGEIRALEEGRLKV